MFTAYLNRQRNFNNGEIIENKPIGFPQDGGKLKPYSNLFYWAHAWTNNKKSTIGLHPHQGFEICSFVLSGKINHFDTNKTNGYLYLKVMSKLFVQAVVFLMRKNLIKILKYFKFGLIQIWKNL